MDLYFYNFICIKYKSLFKINLLPTLVQVIEVYILSNHFILKGAKVNLGNPTQAPTQTRDQI